MIKRIIHVLSSWLSYFKVCRKMYDFDYWSIYLVQRHQLERLKNCLEKDNLYEGCERDVERMNLAIRLLEIVELDDYVAHLNEDGTSDVRWDEGTWKCLKKVNLKNKDRFGFKDVKFKNDNVDEILKGYIYVSKAWYLYHKLLTYYARYWWD